MITKHTAKTSLNSDQYIRLISQVNKHKDSWMRLKLNPTSNGFTYSVEFVNSNVSKNRVPVREWLDS